MMKKNTFVYPIYIATTPEKLWEALTSGSHEEIPLRITSTV